MPFYLNKSTKVKLLTIDKLTAETTAKPSKGSLFSVNLDSSIACLLRTIREKYRLICSAGRKWYSALINSIDDISKYRRNK